MSAAAERETLELDIVIVGGGPAGMSAALRLAQLQKQAGGEPLSIAILEKAREPGAHMLSGAVLDPSTLKDLVPDFLAKGAPLATAVQHDDVYFFTERGQFRLPITPPPLHNDGNYIISLNTFVKWLSQQVEAAGVDIFSGFSASEVLFDGNKVVGVRTGDRGLDKHGGKKPNYEQGVDIRAKLTIFCDGVRGNLTKTLVNKLSLDAGRQKQIYALGIKELWEVPPDRVRPGRVMHTMGYPLKFEEFGGAFIYALPEGQIALGFVSGLDYKDPMFDPHQTFLRFKQHPFVAALLKDGKMVRYGAKALPEGGWHTIPRVHMDGALIAGDAGGFMNSMRLKGIHLAMRTGMLAAETAFGAVRAGDVSSSRLAAYQAAIDAGPVKKELYPVRNVHQAFGHGLIAGSMFAGLSLVTGGWWFKDPMPSHAGHERIRKLTDYYDGHLPSPDQPVNPVKIDRVLTFDKATDVHHSGTRHREDEPSHLIVHNTDICRTKCRTEFGNPCLRFCPANVYEMVDDGAGGKKLHINASNCVHCKTCDIMDPYQIIDWVPPEGGEGPQYRRHVTLSRRQHFEAAAIAALGVPLIEALGGTYTWRERGAERFDEIVKAGRQPILALWHGRILASTLYFRDRGVIAITSRNFDGEWIARIMARFGYGAARGSTSRGGPRALVELKRDMQAGHPAAFTVDGPRGPARVAQPGAIWLASVTGNPILPFHIEASKFWTVKSWDQQQVPKPGSDLAIAIGEPMEIPVDRTAEQIEAGRLELEQRLGELETETKAMLRNST